MTDRPETLGSLVQSIEFYKVQHGAYPESLDALQASLPKGSFVFIVDPSHAAGVRDQVIPLSRGAVAVGAGCAVRSRSPS